MFDIIINGNYILPQSEVILYWTVNVVQILYIQCVPLISHIFYCVLNISTTQQTLKNYKYILLLTSVLWNKQSS